MTLQDFQKEVHDLAIEKGWWKHERNFGEICALLHSEISEAFEDYRNGKKVNEIYYEIYEGGKLPQKPCGIPIELADIVIRLLDFCEAAGIDLTEALKEKHEYNKMRKYRHGGKIA